MAEGILLRYIGNKINFQPEPGQRDSSNSDPNLVPIHGREILTTRLGEESQ